MAYYSCFKKSVLDGNSLLVVMVFLFLSASIVMMASISSALELKMAGQFNEKNEVFRAAEGALNQGASLLGKASSCYQPMQPIQVLRARPAVWWLQLRSDCRLDQGKIKVRFVIESFEPDPCLRAESSSSSVSFPRRRESSLSKRISPLQHLDFFRITIFAMSANHRSVVRLQAVYSVPSSQRISSNECETIQQVRAGRQSWIEF